MPATDPERFRTRTLQWMVVAIWTVMFAGLILMDAAHQERGRHTPWSCAAGFLTALAHGIWISLDCRILGVRVGAWRFAAFFLGPLAIWCHMLVRYHVQSLWMIPTSILIYISPFGAVVIVLSIR